MNLLHLIVRSWRQRPARTALSVASVAIAIATVLGTILAQSGVRRGMSELNSAVDKFPAIEVVATAGGRFSPDLAPNIDGVPGAKAAIPVTSRATRARVKGKRFSTVVAGLPLENKSAWEALLLTEGHRPTKSGEAVLSADVAQAMGAKIGDKVTIIARPPKTAMIVGLGDAGALAAMAPATSLALPIEDVQQVFGLNNQIDRVRVLLSSADDRDAAQVALAEQLPGELFVQTPAAATEMIDTTFRSTQLALRLAGAFSIAMAAFIILNTLRLNFSERRRDFAVVRVLGATSEQLFSVHLVEGLLLGVLGAVVGIPLGILMGWGLEQVMAALLGVTARAPEVSLTTVAGVLVLGPLMAGVAAIVPALQARRMNAAEAMGDAEVRRAERLPVWAVVAGLACWTVSVALVWLVVDKRLPPAAAIPAGILMLVAFVAIIPAVVRPMLVVARLLARGWGVEGQLGADQLLARSTRTGLTIGVLVVALSSGLGLGTAIINNVEDVRSWYRRSLAGDVFLTDPAALDETTARAPGSEIENKVEQQAGVASVVQIRLLSAKVNGASSLCVVRDFKPEIELPWALSDVEQADLRNRLAAGEVALGNVLASQLGLAPGDTLRLEIQGRVFERRIAALVNDYMQGGRCVYMNQQAAAGLIMLGPPYFMIVYATSDTSVAELTKQLQELVTEEGIVVQSFVEMRSQLDGLINGIVFALWGLLAVGFIVGGVAVANTLTLNVLEQTRELGLLRIIGLTPGQTRWLVLCESLLLGLMGAILGTLGGITTAIVIHLCNGPVLGRSVPFELHPWLLAANAGGCLLIALFAAWRPGLWASRLNVLSAIAYE